MARSIEISLSPYSTKMGQRWKVEKQKYLTCYWRAWCFPVNYPVKSFRPHLPSDQGHFGMSHSGQPKLRQGWPKSCKSN